MSGFLTDENCIAQREFVGIPAWHEAGYLGEGVNVFCDDAGGSHAESVADIFRVGLPKANVYTGHINYNGEFSINCKETKEYNVPFDEFVEKYKIKIINNSVKDKPNVEGIYTEEAIAMKEKIKEHNLLFFGAAGNSNYCPTNQKYNGACIMVTSCHLQDGEIIETTRSIGNNIDFAMFRGFQSGTSFSSPFLGILGGLLASRNIDITQEEVYEYLKSRCVDLYEKGEDIYSGWGLPIMEEPKTIIKLTIGSSIVSVDGVQSTIDTAPIIDKNNRTLVPVRFISEALGCEVGWDDKTKTVTITR